MSARFITLPFAGLQMTIKKIRRGAIGAQPVLVFQKIVYFIGKD
jgi:hypothetical protein